MALLDRLRRRSSEPLDPEYEQLVNELAGPGTPKPEEPKPRWDGKSPVFVPPADGSVSPADNPWEHGTPEWFEWRAQAERWTWDNEDGDVGGTDGMSKYIEWVPTSHIAPMREIDRDVDGVPGRTDEVHESLLRSGFKDPVWVDFNPDTGMAHLSEGNHRVTVAMREGIPSVPVSVMRSGRVPKDQSILRPHTYVGGETNPYDANYTPQYMKPSEIGMPTTEPWTPFRESRTRVAMPLIPLNAEAINQHRDDFVGRPRNHFYNEEYREKTKGFTHEDWARQRALEEEWDYAIRHALGTGRISPEQAVELGFTPVSHEGTGDWGSPKWGKWRPLPPTLYHVTTNLPAVMADGRLKSPYELDLTSGRGLGGSASDKTISLTDSLDEAKNIKRAMLEGADVASGRIPIERLYEMAEKGEGAEQPWLKAMFGTHDWSQGMPMDLHDLLHKQRRFWGHDMPEGHPLRGHGWSTPLTEEEWAQHGFYPDQYSNTWMGGDGKPRVVRPARKMTPEEEIESRFDWWRNPWAPFRGYVGKGPSDPLFTMIDPHWFANLDPSHVGIVETAPVPNAHGYPLSSLGEWRIPTGEAVNIVGHDGQQRTAAAAPDPRRVGMISFPGPEYLVPGQRYTWWSDEAVPWMKTGEPRNFNPGPHMTFATYLGPHRHEDYQRAVPEIPGGHQFNITQGGYDGRTKMVRGTKGDPDDRASEWEQADVMDDAQLRDIMARGLFSAYHDPAPINEVVDRINMENEDHVNRQREQEPLTMPEGWDQREGAAPGTVYGYHASPSSNRESIAQEGLRVRSNYQGDVVCFYASDPWHGKPVTFDVWQADLTGMGVEPDPMHTGIGALMVRQPVPPQRLTLLHKGLRSMDELPNWPHVSSAPDNRSSVNPTPVTVWGEHVGTPEAIDEIRQNGFDLSQHKRGTWGRGVYVHINGTTGTTTPGGNGGAKVPAQVTLNRPLHVALNYRSQIDDDDPGHQEFNRITGGQYHGTPEERAALLQAAGYDGVVVHKPDVGGLKPHVAVAFDPASVQLDAPYFPYGYREGSVTPPAQVPSVNLGWRPGERAKGLIDDAGAVHIWPVNEAYEPYHEEYRASSGVTGPPQMDFVVGPDGRVWAARENDDLAADAMARIHQADPRLHVDPADRRSEGFGHAQNVLDGLDRQASATPDKGPAVDRGLYHVTSPSLREQIAQNGLVPWSQQPEAHEDEQGGHSDHVWFHDRPVFAEGSDTWRVKPEFVDHVLGNSHEDTAETAQTTYHAHRGPVPPHMVEMVPPGEGPSGKLATMTLPQEQREWNDLQSHYAELAEDDGEPDYSVDDPQPVALHSFPDGWTVQHHPSMASAQMVGGFMRNCWQDRQTAWQAAFPSSLDGAQFAALHDEHGLPRAAFYWHPQRRIITQPLGMRNDPLTPDLEAKLEQFKHRVPNDGRSIESMAERSGFPELDQAIEEFMRSHPDIESYRDPQNAWGQCEELARECAAFLKQRGFKAYVTTDELGMFPGYENAQDTKEIGAGDFAYPEHAMVEVYGLYGPNNVNNVTIDFTASQYGFTEFPKVHGGPADRQSSVTQPDNGRYGAPWIPAPDELQWSDDEEAHQPSPGRAGAQGPQGAAAQGEEVLLRGVRARELRQASGGDANPPVIPEHPEFPDLDDAVEAHDEAVEASGQPSALLYSPDHLESALGRAEHHWYYGDPSAPPHERLFGAAAALGHGVAQAQAFEDGNKRTAYWLMYGLLDRNGLGHVLGGGANPWDDPEMATIVNGWAEGTHERQHLVDLWKQRHESGGPRQANDLGSHRPAYYHIAPRDARESILQHGIDWQRGEETVPRADEDEWPMGNYLYGPTHAGYLDSYSGGVGDVWEVNPDAVSVEPDPSARQSMDDDPDLWYVRHPIPPEHLTLRPSPRQANILDPIEQTLDPAVFDQPEVPRPRLKPALREWLLDTIYNILEQGGYEGADRWARLYLTGSLTTYQYAGHSDCDISIFVNHHVFPEWSRAEMIGLMVDHCDGLNLPGTPHELQVFVVAKGIEPEDLYQRGLRSGYDLINEEWVVPPERERAHDVEHENPEGYATGLMAADKMERLLRYEPDKAVTYYGQLHRKRMRDQKDAKGDFSTSNLIYKMLANRGLFDRLRELGVKIAAAEPPGDDFDLDQIVRQSEGSRDSSREFAGGWQGTVYHGARDEEARQAILANGFDPAQNAWTRRHSRNSIFFAHTPNGAKYGPRIKANVTLKRPMVFWWDPEAEPRTKSPVDPDRRGEMMSDPPEAASLNWSGGDLAELAKRTGHDGAIYPRRDEMQVFDPSAVTHVEAYD